MKYVTCKDCGWVHFEVSLEYAKNWENEWIGHFEDMDVHARDSFGLVDEPPKIEDTLMNCQRCRASYKNFRDTLPEELPLGSTINPILSRDEDYVPSRGY